MEPINFKNLEITGYVIVHNFLDRAIIEKITEDYVIQKELFLKNNNAKKHKIVPSGFNLKDRLLPIVSEIRKQTNLKISDPISRAYFDNQISQFTWHQDHEPYFKSRDSYNAINFWIPIIKPFLNESGISIIPQDVLEQHCPDIYANKIVGKGAKGFKPQDSQTLMRDDDNLSEISILPVNLDNISISPSLAEGDLLILRQDVIHKTQDSVSSRVAYSSRCNNILPGSAGADKFAQWLNSLK